MEWADGKGCMRKKGGKSYGVENRGVAMVWLDGRRIVEGTSRNTISRVANLVAPVGCIDAHHLQLGTAAAQFGLAWRGLSAPLTA